MKGLRVLHSLHFLCVRAWARGRAGIPRYLGTLTLSVCAMIIRPPFGKEEDVFDVPFNNRVVLRLRLATDRELGSDVRPIVITPNSIRVAQG